MSYWQENRMAAHRDGRHVVPQVDCRLCWDEGRLRSDQQPEKADLDGLWHKGQHSDCATCAAFSAEHQSPEPL